MRVFVRQVQEERFVLVLVDKGFGSISEQLCVMRLVEADIIQYLLVIIVKSYWPIVIRSFEPHEIIETMIEWMELLVLRNSA